MPGYLEVGLLRPIVTGIAVPTDLRVVAPSSLFADGMVAFAIATGDVFAWDSASLTADDGATVIKPNDLTPIQPGRWKKLVLAAAPKPAEYLFGLDGPFADAIIPGTFDPPRIVETARTISTVTLLRRRAGASGSTTVDVAVNGSSIFALAVDRPSVAFGAGAYASSSKPPTVGGGVLAPGDIVEVYLVEKETGDATVQPEGVSVAINFA